MSETLRPWLRQYTLEHAQNQALDMEGVKSTVRICQLIYFRTYEVNEDPNGPPGGLWAEISDGQWHIPVHIPAHSVDAIIRANGSAMTKLTGGIFRVSPMAFVCQCLPVNRSAIERDARLAMRVNVIEYVGSAGENPFKDPKPIMDDATVRTWVRALRGDHDAQQSFSNAVTEALLEEEQRRKANVGRKPSRNGSTIVAGLIPRERERGANQHQRKNSNPSRSAKPRETSKKDKAKERSVKEKGLADYRAAWGKRSLKMKWYLVPDEQCEILKNIEFPTDEEAARSNLASRPAGRPLPALPQRNRDALDLGSMAATSPAARMTALPSSSPLHELPSSLPTQTATSAAMSPELGPPEELDDDDDDEQIEWPTSPVAPVGRLDDDDNGEVEQEEDKFVFATPRPPTQPIILVPNSDPSSRATNSQSQSQSQSIAHGSQPLSQNSNNAHGSLSRSCAQSSQQLRSSPPPQQRSSAAPTHVSDTVLESSSAAPQPQPPAADGNDSLTQSTSQSLSQPQPAQAREPKLEALVVDSVTESTESQSQPQPQPQLAPPGIQVAMDVDVPEPEPEPEPELAGSMQLAEPMDDDDAATEALLLSAVRDVDNGDRITRKRAREDGTTPSPAVKRARRSAEPDDAGAMLASVTHDSGRGTRKRAREERTSRSPVAKRARRSAEPEDGEAEPAAAVAATTITTTRESSAAVSRSRSARARKTVDNRDKASKRPLGDSSGSKAAAERPVAVQRQPPDNHASKTARDDADAGPSSSKRPFARRLGLAIAMGAGPFEPAANRQADVAPSAAPPVKTESPSPVQLQNRSSEMRLPVPDEAVPAVDEEGSPVQPPQLLLQDVMDMLLRLGQRLQREADERARSSR